MILREQIRIRDPFILVSEQEQYYYLYDTTDQTTWSGPGDMRYLLRSTLPKTWGNCGPLASRRE